MDGQIAGRAGAAPAGQYRRMFSPLSIGSAHIANRFAMAPMTTNYAGTAGEVTPGLIDYLAGRARGGFGLIFTENMGVHASGRVMPRMLMADSDALIPGLGKLASALQSHGTRVFAQLSHCGRQSRPAFTGGTLVAPSAIACPINRVVPRALADDEITSLIKAFADAAARVADAGYDGIELHGAHGYLIGEFLSAYANRRDDAWGGTPARRMRFLREIVSAIQARCSLPLCVRLSADELVEGGNRIDDSLRIAQVLAADGVNAISVSAGVYESFNALSMVSGDVSGKWLPLSGRMRSVLPREVTVLGVGRISSAAAAEQALSDDLCDVPLLGRAAIADACIPAKAAGRVQEPVIACMFCNVCLGRSARPETICPVNPAVGRDAAFAAALEKPSAAKIAIRGGGLAALTAAWVAAARGADVELHCGPGEIGGMLAQRAGVPGQQELAAPAEAAWARARSAGVRRVQPGAGAGPGRVLVAVHAQEPVVTDPGHADAVTVYRVLDGSHRPEPQRPYVVAGDDLAAADAALRLASAGVRVTLLTSQNNVAWDAHPGFRAMAREGLARLGVKLGGDSEAVDPLAVRVAGRLQGAAEPGGLATGAVIQDAWDAAAMTQTVYAAVEWACTA